jgi:VCBS repeat-containing protein
MMSANSRSDKPQHATGSGVLSRFLALEPRVLLDAAAVDTAVKMADAASPDPTFSPPPLETLANTMASAAVVSSHAGGGAPEILFVDAGIDDYASLIADLGHQVEVHVLAEGNWVGQIQAALGRRDGDVAAIHIVSHGEAGKLEIGGASIDAGNMQAYASVWSAMRQALSQGGDILVYGCKVAEGETGAAFVQALAAVTGADVAASDDLSGVAALGGDWDLEVKAGAVESASLYTHEKTGFMGLLVDAWVQDTEISTGTSSVAITHTVLASVEEDFKFVGTSASAGPNGHGIVDVYKRDKTTGAWVFLESLDHTSAGGANPVGSIKAQFGYDIAAAGNKLVVSAPAFDPTTANASDGRVFVFTWNGSTWKSSTGTEAVQRIDYIPITGSGQTGYNGGGNDINGSRATADQWGYSVDIASDGNGNYRLVIGNPYEDWYEYDNDDNDGDWGGSEVTRNERDDMGAAIVFQATANGQFGTATNQITQLYSQTGGTTDGHHFGSVVAAGYDAPDSGGDAGHWWVAVGGDGLDQVRMYLDPAANTVINGTTYNHAFTYSGAGPNNVSLDDDWMVIGNSASLQAYTLTGTAWATAGASFGSGAAVVSLADRDYSHSDSYTAGPRLLYSGTLDTQLFTYVADWNAATSTFDADGLINSGRQEVAVALDRHRALDVLVANASGAQSWHFNWAPVAAADTATVAEDASVVINVLTNDTDENRTRFGTLFGDVLAVSAVGSSAYGATVGFAAGNVTYNASTSSYLNTLALGQSVQDVILVTITDGQGGTATAALTVTITGVNDAPTVTAVNPLSPLRVQQSDSTASYDLSAYFTDADQGEAALLEPDLSSIILPSGWSASKNGSLLLITIPAGAAHNSTGTIQVRMQDPHAPAAGSYSALRSFVIQVDAINDAPVLQNPMPDQVAIAAYGFTYQVPESTFFDADPAPYDVLVYSATLLDGSPLPAWLSFDAVNRQFSGTPGSADTGLVSIRVTASDGTASVYDDFSLTIVDPDTHTTGQFASGTAANADFGFSLAISNNGNWMVVGSPGLNSQRGAVYVYERVASTWTLRSTVQSSDGVAGDRFGYSVAISDSGAQIVVGARGDDGAVSQAGAGSVYCYTRAGTGGSTTYGSEGKLQVDASLAQAQDFFGTSVAINESGTFILVGASHFDANSVGDSGAAFMTAFKVGGAVQNLTGFISPQDASSGDMFGGSVAFDQNILVVSAQHDDNPSGMVSRIAFDDGDGARAAATFGSVAASLSEGAQFHFDATRGNVLRLTGTGRAVLDSSIDLGASWALSSWYNMGGTGNGTYRTLTRGSSDHQIIINAGSNQLGTWNNSADAARGFVGANSSEQQLLVIGSTANFTLTLPGAGAVNVTYNATAATLASNIQGALNGLLGAGAATVALVRDGVTDTFRVTFNNGRNYDLMSTNQAANVAGREEHLLAFTATGNFTLTVPDAGTTASITYNATAATLASNVQAALNTLLGAGAATVSVVTDTTSGAVQNDTLRIVFHLRTYDALTVSKAGTTISREVAANSAYTLTAAQLSGWHNLVAVGEGSGINARTTYYVDGVKVGTAYYKAGDDVAVVGNYQDGSQRFADYIDDFRAYDRALTASEVRNIFQGIDSAEAAYTNAGSVYVFSTDLGNAQVAKLYASDSFADDRLGWAIDVDIHDEGGGRQSGVIVASSLYNDKGANEGGAVYVWRSSSLQSGALNNGGAGNGTWQLETKLTPFDVTSNTYSGNDVAVDVDEVTGGTRLVVGAPFDTGNGLYSGAVYAYKYQNGVWLPEKFVDSSPQGGNITAAGLFGNAVDVAGTRAVFGSRYRDSAAIVAAYDRAGAAYSVELLSQGSYSTTASVMAMSATPFAFSAMASRSAFALDTSETLGEVSYDESGLLVYSAGDAFSALAAGETAVDSFVYFTEADGITYANRVLVTVQGEDRSSLASQAQDDVLTVMADSASLLDVLGNDVDAGGLTLVVVAAPGVPGSLHIEGNMLRYDAQGAFDHLRAGESVQQSFSYTAVDAAGQEISAHVTLVIQGVDDQVLAQPDSAAVRADGVVLVNVLGNDSDRDGAETFWVARFDSSATYGRVSYEGNGVFRYVPGEAYASLPSGDTATDRVVYTVRDASGNEYSALLTITVTGVYEGEVISGPVQPGNDVSVTGSNTAVLIPVTENDAGGSLLAVDSAGTLGQVTLQHDGSVLYAPGEALAMLPAGTVYVDRFSYTVRYADGSTATATVTVYVNGEYITSRLDAEEEREQYFQSFASAVESGLSEPALMSPGVDGSSPEATGETVAAMALQGMLEMAAEQEAADAPAVLEPEALLVEDEVPVQAALPAGKPAFSALLVRERARLQADTAALLRSLA